MSPPLQFLLNGEPVFETGFEPQQTLLQWLREERSLSGCKEGCAEGDCGACTVVIAEIDPHSVKDRQAARLRWRSVNACIQLLPMLQGKALFTVEGLKRDGALHPIQQALVDHHGSQCGFCTPGFVMSLFALLQQRDDPDRAAVRRALSGNLCRCTGYRPIVDAALSLAGKTLPRFDETALIETLRDLYLPPHTAWSSLFSQQTWHAPTGLEELSALRMEYPDALLVAGNSDVGLWINKQLQDPPRMIGLGMVKDLQGIEETNGELRIGAAVSLNDAFDVLEARHPGLRPFLDRFASMPVRSAGTLVGNIANASPIGDAPPLLLALDARLLLHRDGRRRELPLQEFFIDYRKTALQPGEFIEAVILPPAPGDLRLAAWKLSKREDQDISAVCAALAMRIEQGRVAEARFAFGGMAAIPKRARQAEQAVLGRPWDAAALQAARAALKEDFAPLTDLRASAEYRLWTAQNLLTRFWFQSLEGGHALTLDQLEAAS